MLARTRALPRAVPEAQQRVLVARSTGMPRRFAACAIERVVGPSRLRVARAVRPASPSTGGCSSSRPVARRAMLGGQHPVDQLECEPQGGERRGR